MQSVKTSPENILVLFRLSLLLTKHNITSNEESLIARLLINTDPQLLCAYSYAQGILPSVYAQLQKLSIAKDFQVHLQCLHRYTFQIAQKNMLLSAELLKVYRSFPTIDILAIKGPVLAQMAYGNITMRQFSDLDLFIKRCGFYPLANHLLQAGYVPYFPIERFSYDEILFDLNNDCPFYHRQRGINIELHWDLFRKLALPTSRFKPWEGTVEIAINGTNVKTLDPSIHLLYHALHGSKHMWERMVWIVDIDRFVRNVPDIDWKRIEDTAKSLGAWRMFLLGIALSLHFYDTPLPDHIRQACHQENFSRYFTFIQNCLSQTPETKLDSLTKFKLLVDLRDDLRSKIAMIADFLFRPGINERRLVVLPKPLFGAYWILRPIGAAYRLLRCKLFRQCTHTHDE